MSNLSIDLEENSFSEEEAEKIDFDDDMYLDRFPDPFEQPIMPSAF